MNVGLYMVYTIKFTQHYYSTGISDEEIVHILLFIQ